MWSLLKKDLFPYILPYKNKVIGSIVFSFALAAIGGAQVKLVKPILDHGLKPESSFNEVLNLALILLALVIVNFPCRFFHFYWIRFVVDRATCQIRQEIFEKIQRLPTAFFQKNKQGNFISHILNDTQIFSYGFKSVVDLIREPLKGMAFLGVAIWSDWQLTLVIFVMFPFLAMIFQVSGKKVKNNQSHVQTEQAELTHNIAEGISAHKITKAFNLQGFVVSRFKRAQEKFFGAQLKTTFVEEMAHPFVELVGGVAFSGVILFSYYRIRTGGTSIGDFISFVAAMAMFMDPIRKFSQANVKLSQARAARDRIWALMNEAEEPNQGKKDHRHFEQEICISDLSFSYGEGDVVSNLNLKVQKGQKVALVGLSGSGKSTLINLLLGLYPIGRGKVTIDGLELQDIELSSLRSLFGLVSQDIFLFHDTILANLTLGKDFSEERIRQALDVAYASEFIDKLSDGVHTVIGDRGTKLSGGQQQRLTIARAFLHDPDILLFDEATSALDNESEKIVQRALEQIAADKTVIAVAHRLTTIQHFDQIYVMSEGKLIEQGSHSELMDRNGEYSKLYQLS